jgi:hypothetical protein
MKIQKVLANSANLQLRIIMTTKSVALVIKINR